MFRPSITIERKICVFTFSGANGSTTAADLPSGASSHGTRTHSKPGFKRRHRQSAS